jgi:hypothetical protein
MDRFRVFDQAPGTWYASRSMGQAAKTSRTHNWSCWNWNRESVVWKSRGERAPAGRAVDENEAPTFGTAGTARNPSACRADPEVHVRAMRLPRLRQRDGGDRLRGEFPTGCGAGEVLCVDQQAREARLQVMRGTGCGLGSVAPHES